MALTFPVLIRDEGGQCVAETPALPGWSVKGQEVVALLALVRTALEEALEKNLEPIGYEVSVPRDAQVHEIVIDEPSSWWWKDPSE